MEEGFHFSGPDRTYDDISQIQQSIFGRNQSTSWNERIMTELFFKNI